MVITKEETFGPAAPLYRFKSEEDAIKMANDTPTLPSPACVACGGGLGRGSLPIFSTAATSAASGASAEALEYGIVGINEGIISPKSPAGEIAPFGGMKESGIGPIWRITGARNTASRCSSGLSTSALAASSGKDHRMRPGRVGRAWSETLLSDPDAMGFAALDPSYRN
jgi:acyl-CoA reductase-like NAD-dependent aldehyde dehydrogenase